MIELITTIDINEHDFESDELFLKKLSGYSKNDKNNILKNIRQY